VKPRKSNCVGNSALAFTFGPQQTTWVLSGCRFSPDSTIRCAIALCSFSACDRVAQLHTRHREINVITFSPQIAVAYQAIHTFNLVLGVRVTDKIFSHVGNTKDAPEQVDCTASQPCNPPVSICIKRVCKLKKIFAIQKVIIMDWAGVN
jgi:hypothetical protein